MKSYQQYCGVARALDLVGQRWALLLVRELLLGPRRFTDLKLSGLGPTLLSQRLQELSAAGLVAQVVLPPPAGRAWALTDEGRRLEPVVLALGAFGASYLDAPRSGDAVSHRWLVVSMQRRWQGQAEGVVGLRFDDVPYSVVLEGGRLEAKDGWPASPDAWLDGPTMALASVLARGEPLGPPVRSGGDSALLEGLLVGLAAVSSRE